MKILLAVDGSKNSLAAVDCLVARLAAWRETPVVELVTVHLPVPKLPRMGLVVSRQQLRRYYEEEGKARLARAKKKLDAAGIGYRVRVLVGPVAETIVKHARSSRCELICIGTRGLTAARGMLLGSVATRVLHLSAVPVLVVK